MQLMRPNRDNHEGMPEIIGAFERDGHFFGVIQVVLDGEHYAFEFGVDKSGYLVLKRVLQFHPFDTLPGAPYRYFFAGGLGRLGQKGGPVSFNVRVEQGRDAKQFNFKGPWELGANLQWFLELRRPEEAVQLRRVEPRLKVQHEP
jgi:hypothetical protein